LSSTSLEPAQRADQRAFYSMRLSLSSPQILAIEVLSRDLEIRLHCASIDMTSQLRYSNGWENSTRNF